MNKIVELIKSHTVVFILITLILFGGFLRFYKLRDVPVSNYWDGVAFSYNAFSILKTGRDEYGNFMPLLFRSFNDYKMPANIYVTVPFVAIFDLNGFSTRASTATAGTGMILVTYFLVKELFSFTSSKKNSNKKITEKNNMFALFSCFLLAISPWAIQFSRAEFEANVGIPFTLMGILFFLKGIRTKKTWVFLIGVVSFSISVYFYRNIIFFTPAMIIVLITLFFKQIVTNKYFIIALFIGLLISFPMYVKITSKEGLIRSEQVSVFTNSFNQTLLLAKKQNAAGNTIISRIIYNRRIVYGEIILQNYLSNLSPNFFFFQGDPNNSRHGPRGMGLLYIWEIPFVLLGLIMVWKLNGKMIWIIVSWILISPIPAAVSIPNPHALRMLNLLPVPQILTALGIGWVFLVLSKKWKIIFGTLLSITVIIFFALYLQNFYGYSARVSSRDWADGYKQLYTYLFQHENTYDRIIVTGHYWKPYIYYVYYKKYDPKTLQNNYSQTHIGKYLFGGTKWEHGQYELENVDLQTWVGTKNVLIALSPDEYQGQKQHIHVLQRIYNHNGELVFIVGNLL